MDCISGAHWCMCCFTLNTEWHVYLSRSKTQTDLCAENQKIAITNYKTSH